MALLLLATDNDSPQSIDTLQSESPLFKTNTIDSFRTFFSKGAMFESIYAVPMSNHENAFSLQLIHREMSSALLPTMQERS